MAHQVPSTKPWRPVFVVCHHGLPAATLIRLPNCGNYSDENPFICSPASRAASAAFPILRASIRGMRHTPPRKIAASAQKYADRAANPVTVWPAAQASVTAAKTHSIQRCR